MSGSCWVSDIRGRMLAREPGAAKRCLPRLKLCPRQHCRQLAWNSAFAASNDGACPSMWMPGSRVKTTPLPQYSSASRLTAGAPVGPANLNVRLSLPRAATVTGCGMILKD